MSSQPPSVNPQDPFPSHDPIPGSRPASYPHPRVAEEEVSKNKYYFFYGILGFILLGVALLWFTSSHDRKEPPQAEQQKTTSVVVGASAPTIKPVVCGSMHAPDCKNVSMGTAYEWMKLKGKPTLECGDKIAYVEERGVRVGINVCDCKCVE